MLGDGRAILLGEHRTPSGHLVDIQLKGAGRHSSRVAVMAALPSGRCSASTSSVRRWPPSASPPREVWRSSPRANRSIEHPCCKGQFSPAWPPVTFASARSSTWRLGMMKPACGCWPTTPSNVTIRSWRTVPEKYLEFFRAVMDRQASLIAQWQLVGFIHGVMNTDNMAISGETIDYGPCAFMNAYDPDTVFSSIDHAGRYAYGNQPAIAQWNLARFAETLLPLIDPDQEQAVAMATEVLGQYPALFEQYWLAGMRAKLGLEQRRGWRPRARSVAVGLDAQMPG